jgi:hypothetical protein
MQKPLKNDKSEKLSFRTAFLWILLITGFFTGSTAVGLFYYRHVKKLRYQQPQYNIVALIQTTPDKELLKTIYLAELLNLSADQPTNLFRFIAKEAQRKLKRCPLMTEVKVKKILPGTVYVDYKLRKPSAYLLDYTNTVLDQEAVAFPFKPFFTPKKLPEIYLGMMEETITWGQPIQGIKSKLALYLIDLITENCCTANTHLTRVDVSHALADSCGQRQIVVIMEDHVERMGASGQVSTVIIPQVLRLSLDNYRQELAHYLTLHPHLLERSLKKLGETTDAMVRTTPAIIDLRIPQLAFIKE